MEPRHPRLTIAVVLALVASVALACGGGGGVDDSPVETAPPGDQAAADRANLVITDFPTEWKSTPIPADALAVKVQNDRDFADCMGRPRPDEIRVATADSPDFSSSETRRASSSVGIIKTAEILRDDYQVLASERGAGCLKTQIDKEFARQLPVNGPQTRTVIEKLDIPQFGEETVAYRVTATGITEGQQVITVIDLVFMRKGRAQLSAAFINRTQPFPQELQRSLLQRMVGRA